MICGTISGYSDDMFSSLQGSGGKTPVKQTTPSGKDLETSVADNDEIKGATVQSTGGSAVSPSRYCAIASLDEAAFDEEEQWTERTSIITKIDHEQYRSYARDCLLHIADEAVTRGRIAEAEAVSPSTADAAATAPATTCATASTIVIDHGFKDEIVESQVNSPDDSFSSLQEPNHDGNGNG